MSDSDPTLGFESRPSSKKTPREHQLEAELQKLKVSVDTLLGFEVYEVITEIATKQECVVGQVLGGGPCGKCPVCLIKDLEGRLRERWVKADWFVTPNVETMRRALVNGVATGKQQEVAEFLIGYLRDGLVAAYKKSVCERAEGAADKRLAE